MERNRMILFRSLLTVISFSVLGLLVKDGVNKYLLFTLSVMVPMISTFFILEKKWFFYSCEIFFSLIILMFVLKYFNININAFYLLYNWKVLVFSVFIILISFSVIAMMNAPVIDEDI